MTGVLTERYPGTVTANNDPERRGRIRATCVGLLGDEESELPMWIEPNLDWGWFVVPDVGEVVEIEAVVGSVQDEQMGQSSIDGLSPKWTGKRSWTDEDVEGQDVPRPIPSDFTSANYGKRRGFSTPLGHLLLFDDTEGASKVTLTWTDGDGKFSFFGIEPDGSFIIGTHTGHTLYFNATDGELSIIDQHGNLYSSDSDGIKIIDKNSDIIEMKGGNIQILAQAGCTVSCADAVIDAGKVQLGGQSLVEAFILGTTFITTVFNAHVHTGVATGPGVSGPPSAANIAAALATLSTKVFGS